MMRAWWGDNSDIVSSFRQGGIDFTTNEIFISVVVPAYNEEAAIVQTLSGLLQYLRARRTAHEIIVVDDGSKDGTLDRVHSLVTVGAPVVLLRNAANVGKGYAVRRGMLRAQGRYAFFMDADASYPAEELDDMIVELDNGYDLVIGSRALPESKLEVRPPLIRYTAGQVYAGLIGLLVFPGIADTQCGFKGFRKEVAHDLFSRLTLSGFAFDVEFSFLARKYGYKIRMVPVTLRFNATDSRVRLLRDSLAMFLDLFKIRFNDAREV